MYAFATVCGIIVAGVITIIYSRLYTQNKKLYRVWNSMRMRCHNVNDSSYHKYGAKGISVCDEWKNNFDAFCIWALANGYKDGLSIDRINPCGNYEPGNCRWTTMLTQQRNRNDNVKIEHNGETRTIAEWCEVLGFSYSCAKARYYRLLKKQDAVTFEDIFSKPNGYRSKRIGQYTLDGTLIKEWDKLEDIKRAGYNRVCVERNCYGKINKPRKYIWKFID